MAKLYFCNRSIHFKTQKVAKLQLQGLRLVIEPVTSGSLHAPTLYRLMSCRSHCRELGREFGIETDGNAGRALVSVGSALV